MMLNSRADKVSLLLLTDMAISGTGGSERFLRNLARLLPAQRYAVEVLQLSEEPEAACRIAPQAAAPHVHLHSHPVGPIYGRAGRDLYRSLRARAMRGDFDIVQSHHEKSDLINALLPRGPADTVRISCRRDMGFQKGGRLKSAFRLLNRRFDRIVAPAQAILDKLQGEENVRPDAVTCIPNGVDTERFSPMCAAAKANMRALLGCAEQEILIGCVASFSPVKRHCDLLNAFAEVVRREPRARLLLIGAGPLQADVEAQVEALALRSTVRLLGPRADVEQVLGALDLFVLASSTEGMSNAVLEAQACGLPVVATAVGGNPDLVSPMNGWLVPPLSPAAMAGALVEACSDPARRATAGRSARDKVQSNHSLAAMAGAFDVLYQDMTARRGGQRGRLHATTWGHTR